MYVSELLQLAEWVINEIEGEEVLVSYQALWSKLSANAKAGSEQQPFESEKTDLIDAIRRVNTHTLSQQQQAALEADVAPHVGERGIAHVEDILYRNALDVATAAAKIHLIISKLDRSIQRFRSLISTLGPLGLDEVEEYEDAVILRVSFSGDASIDNVVQLKHWADTWHKISRGLAMACGETPEEIEVIGASRGSIVISLLLSTVAAGAFVKTVNLALEGALKILEIRIKLLEIRKLKLDIASANEIEKVLENAIAKSREKKLKSIVAQAVKAKAFPKKLTGDTRNAVQLSVSEMVKFMELGGKVEFVLPEITDQPDDNEAPELDQIRKLQAQVLEQRRLQSEVLALEAKLPPDQGSKPNGKEVAQEEDSAD